MLETAHRPLMKSISGVRGWVGVSLLPETASMYGAAFGSWLKGAREMEHPLVVVGRDSRPSGPMYEAAVVSGLASVGCRVLRAGVLSTPGIGVLIGNHEADGGIVITASHNPTPWNGIKALRHDGVAPPADQAMEILRRLDERDVDRVEVDGLQPIRDVEDGVGVHLHKVLAAFEAAGLDLGLVRQHKFKVVLDSVCGAGGAEALALLAELGVDVVPMHTEPTGVFPHVPEPTAANLTGLCDAVPTHGADVGFAQDPDADRLALVDGRGRYIGEEYTLVLCALPLIRAGDTVVANLSTSRMIDDAAAAAGATVARSPVGEANVAAVMREHGAAVGGEGNGGIMWSRVTQVRDSIAGMALVLYLMATRDQPLASIVNALPSYAIVKDKLDIEPGTSGPMLERVRAAMAERFPDASVDGQDGVRFDIGPRWVHVRPSNTEPILRVIAEAPDEAAARELVDACGAVL